jgi:UDPglucose 6-dehydrogenase
VPSLSNADSLEFALELADIVVIATAHSQFIQNLTPELLESYSVRAVIDGRNCLNKEAFIGSSVQYLGIGR